MGALFSRVQRYDNTSLFFSFLCNLMITDDHMSKKNVFELLSVLKDVVKKFP